MRNNDEGSYSHPFLLEVNNLVTHTVQIEQHYWIMRCTC